MKQLIERIQQEGIVLGEDVLKVDGFLTHQVDPALMAQIGQAFAEHFSDKGITKVVTIEAGGIAPALFTAQALQVPLIFARKTQSVTMDEELLSTDVYSFTKQVTSHVIIAKKLLIADDRVLLIDDFLANGQAAQGLVTLCRQVDATVVGLGVVIEKAFQDGRQRLVANGVPVHALARIQSLKGSAVTFAPTITE